MSLCLDRYVPLSIVDQMDATPYCPTNRFLYFWIAVCGRNHSRRLRVAVTVGQQHFELSVMLALGSDCSTGRSRRLGGATKAHTRSWVVTLMLPDDSSKIEWSAQSRPTPHLALLQLRNEFRPNNPIVQTRFG
jgi:hypothetical protein